MAKTPLGRLDAGAFGMLALPRLEAAILEGFRAFGDLTGTAGMEAHNLAEPLEDWIGL